MIDNRKKTGKEWAEIFNIEVISPSGWDSEEMFNTDKIRRLEFLNRCSQSKLAPKEKISRRDAAIFKQNLKNNPDAK